MKKTISGIRGIVGTDFGIKDTIRFCRNFASLTDGGCVTGMDTRPSSEMMMHAAHAGLMDGGASVCSMGMVPTPVVFREARRTTGAGVMVTSSHNPLEWNGLKFILSGRGINGAELSSIVAEQTGRDGSIGTAAAPGTLDNHTSSYVEEAAEIIGDVEGGPRVVVDVGGGAAIHTAPRLYSKIGCRVDTINMERGSRDPDPTTDSLDALVASSSKADAGFAFDLDGDRLVIVMGGAKQSPDTTLGLGVAGALERGCKNFVLSADTSLGVERLIQGGGGISTRAKVGEANVVDEMIRRKAQAGGEGSSGGFILSEFNHCRDGLLAGGMIMSMMQKDDRGKRLREVLEVLGRYHIVRTKIRADPAKHDHMMAKAARWLEARCSEVQRLDGLKGIVGEESWILVRASNTEDAVRISAESDDAVECTALARGMSHAMQQDR